MKGLAKTKSTVRLRKVEDRKEWYLYISWISRPLKKWLEAAGITKKITFHCFRQTFATLQLSSGTDIYTVSKMLGHTNVKTTQIYAKVVDEKKEKAAHAIKFNINKNK
jgi:site-specific recombinase XerD